MVEEAYAKAKELILSHREQLDQLASQLYDKEVLFRDDLERIYGPRPWETPAELAAQEVQSDLKASSEENHNAEAPKPELPADADSINPTTEEKS